MTSSAETPVVQDSTLSCLTVSFLAYNSKLFRLYNNVRARIDALNFQKSLTERYPRNYLPSLFNLNDLDRDLCTLHSIKSDIIRLDYNSVICNTTYKSLFKRFQALPDTIEAHSILIWGKYVPKKSTAERQLNIKRTFVQRLVKRGVATKKQLHDFKDSEFKHQLKKTFLAKARMECLKARKFDLKKRLEHEIVTRNQDNWFMIFNTLTVDPQYIDHVFNVGSKCWTNYVRSIDRAIGIVEHGSWRKAVKAREYGQEFHTYFACVERGAENGNLHIHVLHLCKKLPLNAYDPNRGAIRPNNREIDFFRPYWKYGHSTPIAVRFGQADAYGLIGWRWPVEKIGGLWLSLSLNSPMGLCEYMSKYVAKSIESKQSKGLKTWRIRLSRGLGIIPTLELVKILPQEKLEQIIRIPNLSKVKMFNRPINQRLLRSLAYRQLIKLQTPKKLSMINTALYNLEPREGLLKKLNNVLENRVRFTNPRDGDIEVTRLRDMVDFDISKYITIVEQNYKNIQTYFKARGMSDEVYV